MERRLSKRESIEEAVGEMQNGKSAKAYISVVAEFDANGRIIPRSLHWEDGRTYEIDKVLDCRPAAAMKAGGCGDRYHVRINGRERYLFFERSGDLSGSCLGRWFVEKLVT